jgi:hypothetical protein
MAPIADCQKQGCQNQTKITNLGKLRSVLQRKMLVNFMAIRSISLPFGIFYAPLIYFVAILVYFSHFGMLYQEKSGNPCQKSRSRTKRNFLKCGTKM